jgi:hypothetical protein
MSLADAARTYWVYSKALKGQGYSFIDPVPMLKVIAVTQQNNRVGKGAQLSPMPLAYSAAEVVELPRDHFKPHPCFPQT